jgi:small-conductance mechanosensitive channel
VLPSVSLGTDNWRTNIKNGFKYSGSSYIVSLLTFIVILSILAVFTQPIAFIGSLQNEYRGVELFPDILDLLAEFIEKITSSYGLNGVFWANILRQTIYVVVLMMAIPLYTISTCFLFSNMQEIKTAKSLYKEFKNFGKRNRFKETEVED